MRSSILTFCCRPSRLCSGIGSLTSVNSRLHGRIMSTLSVLLLWTLLSPSAALQFYRSGGGLTAVPVDQIDLNTTNVSVVNNLLTSIRGNPFRTFHQLSTINLYRNEISFISSKAFDGTILDVLDISHNRLRSLPSFYSVRSTLSTINAGYNTIETLGSEVFNYCRKLRYVYLGNNLLSFIDDDAFSGTNLSTLYLSNNLLRALPSFFSVRRTLSTIYADYNTIEKLNSEVFNDCRNLSSIYLRNNLLSFIDDDAFSGTNLSTLYLSNNRLRALPSFFSVRSSLPTIYAQHNAIETLDRGVFNDCGKLKSVYLQNNVLSYISADAFNGTILSAVDISNNRLRALPSFESVKNTLYNIKVDSNALKTIDNKVFRNCTKLRYVHLRSNSLSFISNDAFNGTILQELYLSRNRMRALPSLSSVRNTLTRIDADFNSIVSLGDEPFRDLEALQYVNVENNNISYISDNAFNGTSLGQLHLSNNRLRVMPSFSVVKNSLWYIQAEYNEIEMINDETFRDLRQLLYVYLRHNQISSISSKAFNGTSLYTLDVSYNHLKEWPQLLSDGNTLYEVYAFSNAIEKIGDEAFRDLYNHWEVYLQDNAISFISDSAFNGTWIYMINISNNRLQALPSFYSIRHSLYVLHASNNSIMRIRTNVFYGYRQLSRIDLDGNQISFIADDAFTGIALRHLNLSGNRLTSLSPLQSLRYIVTLDVKNNFIETSSGHDFLNLTRLSYIDLSSNRLTAFSASISNSIRTIKADDNQIDYIEPLFFSNKSSLYQLSIKNNRLSDFPDFIYLPERNVLTSLSLSHNRITDLAATALYNTPKLGLLDLTGNRLTRIPILYPTALSTLCLQDNVISEIPEYRFEGMSLISLNLSNNRLRYFPNVFPLNASIEILDLSNNHIGPVASGVILKLLQVSYRLQYIDLHNIGLETIPDIRLLQHTIANVYMLNPDSMRCDCRMNWMSEFIKKSANITNVTDITADSTPCASPAGLVGKELSTITFDDLCNPSTSLRDTCPPTQNQTRNVGSSVQVSAVGASLGTLLLLAILLIVFLVYRHVLQRPLAVSKTTDGVNGNTNEAYDSIEIAQISQPESNTYAELQVTNAQKETDPYSVYDNC